MSAVSLPFEPADAIQVVRDAACLAKSFLGQVTPDVKADNTLVTAADKAVEAFLNEKLAALSPGYAFLGEETGLSGDPDAPCWVIDPIDGTTNFVRGIPIWSVSVGLVHRGKAIFGVLAVPPLGELFWAVSGGGTWWHEDDGDVSKGLEAPLRLRVTDSDIVTQEELIACNTSADETVNFRGVPCRLRNLGSLAYHLAAVSKGALVACVAEQHKLYDVAAGICLCEEAGCAVRYMDGGPWQAEVNSATETRALLVAPPRVLDILLQRLQKRENR